MSLDLLIENLKKLHAMGYKGEFVINFNGTSITDAYLNKQRLTSTENRLVAVA